MDNDDAMKNERCLIKKIIKNNEKFVQLFFGVLVLTFLMGFYDERNMYIELKDITLELGDVFPNNDITYINNYIGKKHFVIEDNIPKNDDGQTIKIGTYDYYIVYRDEERKYSRLTNKRATVSVVDTIKPEIKLKETSQKFEYGSKINANDIADCYDLSECVLSLKNKIDSNKSGVQEVIIIAKDEGNNVSEMIVNITIKNKPVYYSNRFSSMNDNNNLLNSYLDEGQKKILREKLIEYAKQFEGNPYVYGGNSLTNGIDCSGFTKAIYNYFGYQLPRSAGSQGYLGKNVKRNELLLGDLVVYNFEDGGHHVGIYIGNGKMIHAGTEKTGIIIAPIFEGNKVYRRLIY